MVAIELENVARVIGKKKVIQMPWSDLIEVVHYHIGSSFNQRLPVLAGRPVDDSCLDGGKMRK